MTTVLSRGRSAASNSPELAQFIDQGTVWRNLKSASFAYGVRGGNLSLRISEEMDPLEPIFKLQISHQYLRDYHRDDDWDTEGYQRKYDFTLFADHSLNCLLIFSTWMKTTIIWDFFVSRNV